MGWAFLLRECSTVSYSIVGINVEILRLLLWPLKRKSHAETPQSRELAKMLDSGWGKTAEDLDKR